MPVNKLKYYALLLAFFGAAACSDKEIPQGVRLSVLPDNNLSQAENVSAKQTVKIPAAKTNYIWSQNGGNSEHLNGNIAFNFPLEQAWRKNFGKSADKRDFLISEPIVVDDTIYTLDADANIFAVKLGNGEEIWHKKLLSADKSRRKTSLKASGLAAFGDKIIAAAGFGEVFALNAKDGRQVWHFDAKTPIRVAPTVANGNVFVQTINNHLFAINIENGEKLWDYEVMQEDTTLLGGASPAFENRQDILVAAFSSGEMQAFKASTGSPLWTSILVSNKYAASASPINAIKANPVIDDDLIFAIGNNKVFAAIDARSGEKIWELALSGNTQPIVSGEYVFAVSQDNIVYAVNKESGKIVWQTAVKFENHDKNESLSALNPLLLNDKILVAFSNGKILLIDALSGGIIKESSLETEIYAAPIAVNKKLVFITAGSEVIVYE